MTMTTSPTDSPSEAPQENIRWYSLSGDETVARLGVDAGSGLGAADVTSRLAKYGKNEVATEPPPTTWQMARAQIANPMNIMLLIVSIASFTIGQIATGTIVMALVLFNVIMGTNQERKAMASVDALAQLQVPTARVRRDGTVEEVDSVGLVPGDILLVEAGDLVPADARILSSASLEVQEASLTGESAPIAKDSITLADEEQPLGDRTNLVFQNTQVTRGSAELVVVATGQSTQMGQIANMVTATKRTKSPLQVELDGLTKIFGFLAWGAVAIIAIVGIARDQDRETLMLLCISTAISAIPTGLPTYPERPSSPTYERWMGCWRGCATT
jgi:Ca2+-transporting ATPase